MCQVKQLGAKLDFAPSVSRPRAWRNSVGLSTLASSAHQAVEILLRLCVPRIYGKGSLEILHRFRSPANLCKCQTQCIENVSIVLFEGHSLFKGLYGLVGLSIPEESNT